MSTSTTKKAILTTSVAAICIGGPWVSPAQATTEGGGGGSTASSTAVDEGEVMALRKAEMSRNYLAHAADRIEHTALARWAVGSDPGAAGNTSAQCRVAVP